MKKFTFAHLLWFISILMFLPPALSAQEVTEAEEVEPVDTYLSLIATYTSNDTVVLTATLYIRKGRERIDLQNAPISFSVSGNKEQMEVGEAFTDSTGTAQVMVPVSSTLFRDEEGLITYMADFEGTEKYLSASEMFMSKPSKLEVAFFLEDSIRYIRVTGLQFSSNGETEPIMEETVLLFVPALFRPLPIGEVWLDEEGSGSIEFPITIIGDSLGNIKVIARIDEHDSFGYVKGEGTCGWAVPKHLLSQDKPTRELWTPVAPIWMMITLLILLAGVWGHYIYAVIELIKIRRSAKKESFEEKDWSNYS
ncbi:MAG: hypothetical protein ABIK52_07095 [Bacteroidota bacterium]